MILLHTTEYRTPHERTWRTSCRSAPTRFFRTQYDLALCTNVHEGLQVCSFARNTISHYAQTYMKDFMYVLIYKILLHAIRSRTTHKSRWRTSCKSGTIWFESVRTWRDIALCKTEHEAFRGVRTYTIHSHAIWYRMAHKSTWKTSCRSGPTRFICMPYDIALRTKVDGGLHVSPELYDSHSSAHDAISHYAQLHMRTFRGSKHTRFVCTWSNIALRTTTTHENFCTQHDFAKSTNTYEDFPFAQDTISHTTQQHKITFCGSKSSRIRVHTQCDFTQITNVHVQDEFHTKHKEIWKLFP